MASHIVANELILKVAGHAHFDLGKEDYEAGLVSKFQSEGDQVSAKVGAHDTSLRYKNEAIEGSCSCPDSDGFEFCRHCVALALHGNKVTQQLFALSKGPDKSKILSYLLQLDKQDLAKQFLNVIEQDEQLKKKFLLKASLGSQNIDFSALRSEVTKITKVDRQLFSQRQVKHFFARIESFLAEILNYGHYDEPDKMAKIVEYCLSRINKLLRSMDDSSNQRGGSVELLQELYRNLLIALPGGTEQTVKRFYRQWLNDEHALLGNELDVFFAHDADNASKQFIRLIDQSWIRQQKNAGKHGAQTAGPDFELDAWQVSKLAQYQLERAKQNQDIEAEINLRTIMAKTPDDHLTLAERLHEKGELHQAIRSARSALALDPHSQLALGFLVGLMELKNDLLEPFIDLFEQYPDQVLDTLLPYAERHERLDETIDRCIDILQKKRPAHCHELVSLLLKRNKIEEAFQLSREVTLNNEDLLGIASATSAKAPEKAVSLYQKAIDGFISKGLNKSYERAIASIHELMPLMGERNSETFISYIERLGITYRNKAPFIQMLKQAFN